MAPGSAQPIFSAMKAKRLGEDGMTQALVFDVGDDVLARLLDFARRSRVAAARFSGIGGFSDVVLGYFDIETRQYRRIPVDEQVEVVSLNGDIALRGDEPMVHAHVVVGRSDGTVRAGHLLAAHVRPTLELVVVASPAHLRRRIDARTGLPLLDLDL